MVSKKSINCVNWINIITVICVAIVFWLVSDSAVMIYKKLAEANQNLHREQDKILNNYKKVAIAILKNQLPQNSTYFNALSNIKYGLPSIREFIVEENNGAAITTTDYSMADSKNVIGCYDHKCIKVSVPSKDLADKILSPKLKTKGVITAPVSKFKLLQITLKTCFEEHKYLLALTFFWLTILYLIQALYLFRKNVDLNKNHAALCASLEDYKNQLAVFIARFNKLHNGIQFIQERTSEYFVHYMHQLIDRNPRVIKVDLVKILKQVEQFLSCFIVENKATIIIKCEQDAEVILSDHELIFIVLLNLVYAALYRTKAPAQITIHIKRQSSEVIVEIIDNGFLNRLTLDEKVLIYELPEPIIRSLCQKIDTEIKEERKGKTNTTTVRFGATLMARTDNNVIKLHLHDKN